ncbi:hypothetical protein [Bacillus toyonensis]|uniref:hypothetical protein n=1 Tax=Bacillus toyonensis TaxID=155322 RepID=UPI000BF27429|nr:hypothetical protein [Bacillus toyonensis]PGF05038.1 hypothetical protein COM61_00970 [Bacillus toyonensis]
MTLRVLVGRDRENEVVYSETSEGLTREQIEYDLIPRFEEHPSMTHVEVYEHEGTSFNQKLPILREYALNLDY